MRAALLQKVKDERKDVVKPANGKLVRRTFDFYPRLHWAERVMAGAPQTGLDWNIFDVGRYFLPENGEPMRKALVLINFGGPVHNDGGALEWAKNYRIKPADPRKVFALGKSEPRLDRILETKLLVISSLHPAEFRGEQRTPCLAWDVQGDRRGFLAIPEMKSGQNFWFAFEES